MEMRAVYSSHVVAIGYDAGPRTLRVEWRDGRASLYQGVPPETAEQVMNAPSIGAALQPIKAQYRHSYE